MKTNIKKILFYILAAMAVGGIVYVVFFNEETTRVSIETVLAKTGSVRTVITATGTVEPINQVEVGTQVSGVIEKIYADYNSTVRASQLIAELDKTNLKATVAEAAASLNTALNELDYRQKNFDRTKKLHDSRMVSDLDYEEALYNLNNAKGTVEQRRSDLSRANTNLGYASIYSPIDGVVLSRSVEVGQTVAASYSTPTLFTIAQDLKQMQVEADVDEADIGQVQTGQRVTFTVDAYPDEEFSGTVTQIRLEPVETSNVVTYTVIIKADNPEGKLMPGLTASISIYTLEVNNVLTLEARALNFQPDPELMTAWLEQHGEAALPDDAGKKETLPVNYAADKAENVKIVWIKEGATVYPQRITTGASDGISVQITDGLKNGDEVVFAMKAAAPAATANQAAESPFMPKPPGKK